jgi:hypothetical protein
MIHPITSAVPDLSFLSLGTYASRLRLAVASAARSASYLFQVFYGISFTYLIITYLIRFNSLIMVCGAIKEKSTSYTEIVHTCLQFNGGNLMAEASTDDA